MTSAATMNLSTAVLFPKGHAHYNDSSGTKIHPRVPRRQAICQVRSTMDFMINNEKIADNRTEGNTVKYSHFKQDQSS
jgi:hypothetical protein